MVIFCVVMNKKWLFFTVFIVFWGAAIHIDGVFAQDDPSATPQLRRPTIVSTGLPPVVDELPPSDTPRPSPSQTATLPLSPTKIASDTPSPSPSNTPTQTPSVSPSGTQTESITPSQTKTATPTPTDTPSPTSTDTPTNTPTQTLTNTPTVTETPSDTPEPINVISTAPQDTSDDDNALNTPIFMAGLVLFLVFVSYFSIYAFNSAALERYNTGFVIQTCPVCQSGHLDIEERPYRALGVPRVRRTVRCDHCHSILREVGRRRWRYTVDPRANPELFESTNGLVLNEEALLNLTAQSDAGRNTPHYMESDDDARL